MSKGRPNVSLYVRGLSESSRVEEVRELFDRYGRVRDVYLPLDYYTRRPRGFAYVEFEDVRDAEDALYECDGLRLHGRKLEVEFAVGDRKTPNQMRGKYGSSVSGYDRSPGRRRRSRSRDRSDRNRSSRRKRSNSRSRSRSPRRRRHRSPTPDRSRSRSRSGERAVSRSKSKTPIVKTENGDDFVKHEVEDYND